MLNNQLISIITVSLNSEKTITRSIESVLNQNYKNLEYIIIDGGSTDDTLSIIKKYATQISKIVSEPDEGISDAFNKGINLASGEIIGILNSDDWYEEGTLETVSKLLADDKDFLVGSLRYWGGDGRNFDVKADKNYGQKIKYKMPHLNHPASFFKKSVYNSVGLFNLKYRYAMDYDFFLRTFIANKKATFTEKVLTNMSLSGASDKNAIKAYRETAQIAKNKIIAWPYFIYSAIKYYIRILLVRLQMDKILLSIRRRKYKN